MVWPLARVWVRRGMGGNQQCYLHFQLLLEDTFEQLSGIINNINGYEKSALFMIMMDSCLRII